VADVEPGPDNDYQVSPTLTFSRARWNAVMASIAARLKARELLEATFETLITDGTQAALDMISVNVAPQLESLIEQINTLEEQLEDIISGGVAPDSLQLGGKNPSFYLALANATGALPVAQVTGVDAMIAAAVAALVNGSPATLDTLKELSDALGGDANFAASVAASLGSKVAKASNLSDLTDKDTALGNLLGGAIGIAVFKAATKAAARAAIDAVSKVGGDTMTGDYATDGSLTAATDRVEVGSEGLTKIMLYNPAAGTNLKRSYIYNSGGKTTFGSHDDAVTTANGIIELDHATGAAIFSGSIRHIGESQTTYALDTSSRSITAANNAAVMIATNFSGRIMVCETTGGKMADFLCSGGVIKASAGDTTLIECVYAAPQNGYAIFNKTGATGTFTVMTLRLRDAA
jgi:hypothetical protein